MNITILQSIISGLVQGITEFLPVSSSGHLMLVPYLFNFKIGVDFMAMLHLGTMGAVLLYFWRDWMNIFGLKKDMPVYQENPHLLKFLIIGTIPVVIIGFLINGSTEKLEQSPVIVALMIFIGGLILWWSDQFFPSKKLLKDLRFKDVLLIGFFQVMALIPGISRSGITMAVARFLKVDRVDAARFSFLLGTPVILGAGILKIKDFPVENMDIVFWSGMIISFLSGILTIHFFLTLLQKVKYTIFFWYSLALVVLILFLAK